MRSNENPKTMLTVDSALPEIRMHNICVPVGFVKP